MAAKPSVADSNVISTRPEGAKNVQLPSDLAPRPGFRAPANTRSKAQKAQKAKKKTKKK